MIRDTMLHYLLDVPADAVDGAPLLVLLHGRGSDERDLMGLRPHLPDGWIVASVRAPHPGAPWGYGPGWAWYRYQGGTTPEPDSFDQSQERLGELLAALPERLPVRPGAVVLGGFSQGGTTSLGYALRNPGAVSMAVNFSGFLPDHPSVEARADTVRGTRFFWAHGRQDPNIPFQFAEQGRQALREAGAELDTGDYAIGHWIAPDELRDVVRWIEQGVGTDTGSAPRP